MPFSNLKAKVLPSTSKGLAMPFSAWISVDKAKIHAVSGTIRNN